MHLARDTVRQGPPCHGGALNAGSEEHELRIAVLSHCNECGGQMSGVYVIVERTDRDDRGDTGLADQSACLQALWPCARRRNGHNRSSLAAASDERGEIGRRIPCCCNRGRHGFGSIRLDHGCASPLLIEFGLPAAELMRRPVLATPSTPRGANGLGLPPNSVVVSTPRTTRSGACAVTMTQRIPVRAADVVNADRQLGPPLTRLRAYLLAATDPIFGAEVLFQSVEGARSSKACRRHERVAMGLEW